MKNEKNIQRVRKWQEAQKSKGLCIECSNIASGLRCEDCNRRRATLRKDNYNKWKDENKCCQCGKDVLENKNYCEKHYLMKISHSRLGTSKYWKDLKVLLEQQKFKCALTGDDISFKLNIELDHIIPTFRGGVNELKNVQWTTKKANSFKRTCTQEELKEICIKIANTI